MQRRKRGQSLALLQLIPMMPWCLTAIVSELKSVSLECEIAG